MLSTRQGRQAWQNRTENMFPMFSARETQIVPRGFFLTTVVLGSNQDPADILDRTDSRSENFYVCYSRLPGSCNQLKILIGSLAIVKFARFELNLQTSASGSVRLAALVDDGIVENT